MEIGVEPGDRQKEENYVDSIDGEVLRHCKDPSDCVLLATAIKTKSAVLTKDKHHLFNAELENFVKKYNTRVYKELKDVL
ncbi:hypothetical protein GF323_02240 [Candidatus Woesearchaeota archaeon]|nr:hypothetical protein [Candidatus Woesearchaeota archaeon]